ncbi:nuclear transport factor 2 family protein [Planotetraspora phitsanulokensis]|uniref:Ketosteroid isomerase n=1 Tax=Planotetraspora phitsanulokensis TaxID=575192 RepID=A0A8J3UB09_9ACTN|nr:nuclear transport factor 2 family protein [Planotetraspora phitsanulokensis]GII35775.1 ketosteroid isomerase [Planotetraspora phitsanulokensis]
MSPQESVDRQRELTDLYAAFNRRDIPAVLSALAADVVWPNGWEGGAVRGHDEVREYWTRQWAQIEPTVVPTGFTRESDGRVAVTVHQIVHGKDGEVIMDGQVTHVYGFRDDLVTDMEIRQ